MLLFGVGWTSAYATIQAAAQLVCPPWVRARSLSIYQLAQNGALTIGSFGWGWVGGKIGLPHTFLAAAVVGRRADGARPLCSASRRSCARRRPRREQAAPLPEAPAPELVPLLRDTRGRVMEIALLPRRTAATRRIPEDDA